jgi:hypothetical protein
MAMPLPYNWFLPVDKSNSVAQVVPAATRSSSFRYMKKGPSTRMALFFDRKFFNQCCTTNKRPERP